MLLGAVYLPPFKSKYGLRSRQQLEDFFARLGDEAAEGMARLGGADLALVGDWNAHLGNLQESGEYSSSAIMHAIGGDADELLAPCASDFAPAPPTPANLSARTAVRESLCTAPICEQGRALLQFCSHMGLWIMNGRLPGDEFGSPTCYAGAPSVIDLFIASAGLFMQATRLRVLEAIPEYTVHRPLELSLVLAPRAAGVADSPPARSQHSFSSITSHPTAAAAAADGDTALGPPPSLPPDLRLKEDLLPAYSKQLTGSGVRHQLSVVTALAETDPEQAAGLLHTTLYEAAKAVFPHASSSPRRQPQHSGLRQLPYFDRECMQARQRARQSIRALMTSEPHSHLSRQAVRVVSSKYRRLLDRKAALWRQQRSKALLQLHHFNPRAFARKWKRKVAANPLGAKTWLPFFIQQQSRLVRKHSQPEHQPQPVQQPTAAGPTAEPSSPASAPPPSQEDPSLDQDISIEDVQAAFTKLSSSSSCLGPLKAALIKAGKPVLVPVLASLFTSVYRSGKVPREWLAGAITAIYKGKGDPAEPNNYRGITVGHVLGKLYALTLNLRLSAWAESKGKRALGQSGFRRGFRTTDNCFILRAVVERARAQGMKLYICAVDLEKAFDSVDRQLLWAGLQRAGIGGRMLATLQALYADVPVCVRTDEGLSSTFQSIIGVKQGCPLSPLLFGIFLDDFELHIERTVPAALAQLPLLCGRVVPPLLFADDMLLLSTSAAGLNAQLQSLQAYCGAKKLTVNAAKTQVMIMRPGGGSGGKLAKHEAFFYAGQKLEVVKSIKYLGLSFGQLSKAHGFACCAEELAKAGWRALFATRRRAWELGAAAVQHQSQLFDIFVKPVLSYGCEIWGVDILDQPDSAPERVHRWLCRRLLGLPQGASSAVALAELGRWPLHVHWVQQLARFWNRMIKAQESERGSQRLVSLAFQDNLSLMQEQLALQARTGWAEASPCWCLRWLRALTTVAPTDSGTLLGVTALDEEALVARARAQWVRAAAAPAAAQHSHENGTAAAEVEGDGSAPPRIEVGEQGAGLHGGASRDGCACHPAGLALAHQPVAGSKFAYYLGHIRGDTPLGQMPSYLLVDEVPDARHRICLTRFRCSSHDLRVERDRYLPAAVKPPRHMRTCLICASQSVEDEHHFIFECPLYDSLRFKFSDLFSTDCSTVHSFLDQSQDRVAEYLYSCFELRRRTAYMSLAGSDNAFSL